MCTSRLLGAVCACVFVALTSTSYAASISGQGTWETTLQPRDLDGNLATAEAYYDTDLNITWLANANAGAGSAYDDGLSTDGAMSWANANAWAGSLNISGITGWRLPNTNPVNGMTYDYSYSTIGTTDTGYNMSAPGTTYAGSTGSEMAHLFFNTLGDKAYYNTSGVGPQSGWGLTNTGPFSNVQSDVGYWSATEYAPVTDGAWYFHFGYGAQASRGKILGYYGWAVHSGDVGTPIVGAITISIDIKPGSSENPVNPGAHGVLPVAILTTEDFDASQVDVSTIQFGQGQAQPVHYALEDVDSDTDWDLVLQFKTQDTGIVCGDTEVTLTGKTLDGVSFTGTDSIRTVGCKKVH